ncbi:MAG TPA: hypothetical protein LFW11_02435 [Rickettsia endosymbiont of Proechinophthirus fluctus]|uniref:hypothetical protein n=1 Tax=Rickettsia endosymbiont of Proechinophthirus fluctus TaxID=1462733 RepID=UPI000789CF2A|nr:hypothetical protein [Rickettsia endosymbiont of Proechinophthirus fluctus]KYP98554.1 hypothetical protein BG75_01865 [Rickettsia endosymbiont of Proechinophthirus fluctus]HJD54224.1 hypothetical protein [Rickettsia endosymbiont of Proechinophthirus fluctus]
MAGVVPPPLPLPGGVAAPPPAGVGIRLAIARDIANLDAIGNDELKLAGYKSKGKRRCCIKRKNSCTGTGCRQSSRRSSCSSEYFRQNIS